MKDDKAYEYKIHCAFRFIVEEGIFYDKKYRFKKFDCKYPNIK